MRVAQLTPTELAGRGVDITKVQQLGPQRTPGSRFNFFADPDGSGWAVQEFGPFRSLGRSGVHALAVVP